MKKKISMLSFAVCVSFIISSFTTVFAKTDSVTLYGSQEIAFDSIYIDPSSYASAAFAISEENTAADITAAAEYTAARLDAMHSTVNIYEYQIPAESAAALVNKVINDNPNLFYLSGGVSYSKMRGYIYEIMFNFNLSGDELEVRKAAFNAETDKILSLVNADMSDISKLLTVHDYFCLNYEYSEPIPSPSENPSAYRADGVMVDKTGVCQSYTYAFKHILNKMGIESAYAVSNDMNHIWNVVKLGSNWYHTDITWDDPLGAQYAYVRHNNFLLSDSKISSGDNPHYNWISDYACTSELYDDAFWQNAIGSVTCSGGKYYYVSGYNLCVYDSASQTETVLYTNNEKWKVWNNPSAYYTSSFSSSAICGDKIYVSTPSKIISLNKDGSNREVFYTHDLSDGYIYGMKISGNTLYFAAATAPNSEYTEYDIPLLIKYSVIIGDVNGDGVADDKDASLIMISTTGGSKSGGGKYEIGKTIASGIICGDVNGDGVADDKDASLIMISTTGGSKSAGSAYDIGSLFTFSK